jgi:hypothetical protein
MSSPEKLAKQIEDSPLDNPVRDGLLRRLKVANSAGRAAIVRDFDDEMKKYRARILPCCRKELQNKKAITLNTA